MVHYVCTGGCNGVSQTPGNCNAESCARFNQPLTACSCADGKHREVYEHQDVGAKNEN